MENKPQSDLGQSRPPVRRPTRVPARFPTEGAAPVATEPRPAPTAEPAEARAMPAVQRPVPPKPAPVPLGPEDAPAEEKRTKRTKNARRRSTKRTAGQIVWLVVRRILVVIFTLILLLVVGVFALCYTVATGPSPTIRNWLVLTAMQTSAAKWVPGLFMSDEEVAQIGIETRVIELKYDIGDSVKISSGPLAGFIGTVQEISEDKKKIKVLASLFGRDTAVELDAGDVTVVEN